MNHLVRLAGTILLLVVSFNIQAQADIFLDWETPTSGSNIVSDGFVTTPSGQIDLFEDSPNGASINGFGPFPNDLPQATYGNRLVEAADGWVGLNFSFDVAEITFYFGGDGGDFQAEVLNQGGSVLDSIFIPDLPSSGQPPGPITLSGTGIRTLRFQDPRGGSAIDDVEIYLDQEVIEYENIPTLSQWGLILLMLTIGLVAWRHRERRLKI